MTCAAKSRALPALDEAAGEQAHALVAGEHARSRRGSSRARRHGRCAPRARSTGRARAGAAAPSRPTGLPSMRIAVSGSDRALARERQQQLVLAVAGDAGDAQDLAGPDLEARSLEVDAVRLLATAGRGRCDGQPRLAAAAARRAASACAARRRSSAAPCCSRSRPWGRSAHHLAAAQDRGAVAERFDLVQLVADVEDRAALGRELAQGLEQLARPPAASAPRSARP